MDGDGTRGKTLRDVNNLEEPFHLERVETPIFAITLLLQHRRIVLTSEYGAPVGIVTNTDVGKVFADA